MKDGDTYYVFGSHIEAAESQDLMNWSTFTNGYKTPDNVLYGDLSANLSESFAWAGENDSDSKGGFSVWAPDVFWNEDYVNEDGTKGTYMMYYSTSSTYIRSAIGYAVSQNIKGPYTYGEPSCIPASRQAKLMMRTVMSTKNGRIPTFRR